MNSLNGAHVLVTRPQHQAANLCRLIEQHRGIAVEFPTLEIISTGNRDAIVETVSNLQRFQWVVFISANAVNFALSAIDGTIDRFHSVHIAAIGQATARALESEGLHPDLTPINGSDSQALLAMPAMQAVSGQRILIVRGVGGLEYLGHELKRRGADIDYLEVYRRVIPDVDPTPLIALLRQNRLNLITATSGEALQNLLIMLGEDNRRLVLDLPLIVISGRIRHLAEDMGFKRVLVSDSPSDTAILTKITSWVTGAESGRID